MLDSVEPVVLESVPFFLCLSSTFSSECDCDSKLADDCIEESGCCTAALIADSIESGGSEVEGFKVGALSVLPKEVELGSETKPWRWRGGPLEECLGQGVLDLLAMPGTESKVLVTASSGGVPDARVRVRSRNIVWASDLLCLHRLALHSEGGKLKNPQTGPWD